MRQHSNYHNKFEESCLGSKALEDEIVSKESLQMLEPNFYTLPQHLTWQQEFVSLSTMKQDAMLFAFSIFACANRSLMYLV